MKVCKVDGCEGERYDGSAYCHEHYLAYRRELRRRRKAAGLKVRTTYPCVCLACGKEYQGFTKTSLFCSRKCFASIASHAGVNQYVYDSTNYRNNIWQHRNIAETVLGRKLSSNEIVHHIDGNPKNNDLTNLIVISRGKHKALHTYLDIQRAILERSGNVNSENCWDSLIIPMTTAWLETAGVTVQKLWEVGQSAAEPLSNEEGSETMHGASHVDEDIVQTTTQEIVAIAI